MYYILKLDDFHFVGNACGQLASQEHAFKFTSLLHAKTILSSWRANYPRACLIEVNEWERCTKPVIA